MRFVCFKFCQLSTSLESAGHSLWVKHRHDAIQTPRNLKIARWKHSCEDFTVFRCQSVDCAKDSKGVGWVQLYNRKDLNNNSNTNTYTDTYGLCRFIYEQVY